MKAFARNLRVRVGGGNTRASAITTKRIALVLCFAMVVVGALPLFSRPHASIPPPTPMSPAMSDEAAQMVTTWVTATNTRDWLHPDGDSQTWHRLTDPRLATQIDSHANVPPMWSVDHTQESANVQYTNLTSSSNGRATYQVYAILDFSAPGANSTTAPLAETVTVEITGSALLVEAVGQ